MYVDSTKRRDRNWKFSNLRNFVSLLTRIGFLAVEKKTHPPVGKSGVSKVIYSSTTEREIRQPSYLQTTALTFGLSRFHSSRYCRPAEISGRIVSCLKYFTLNPRMFILLFRTRYDSEQCKKIVHWGTLSNASSPRRTLLPPKVRRSHASMSSTHEVCRDQMMIQGSQIVEATVCSLWRGILVHP